MLKSVTVFILVLLSLTSFADEPTDEKKAAEIYEQTCIICHGEGMHGAPRPGIKPDWEQRLTYGVEDMYLNTIEGIGIEMPPKGMCSDCSDEQIRAVVDFMLKGVQ